jgi:hypothetical protein
MKKRIAVALAAGAAVATVGFASASALTVDAATIQYGTASVTGDADGVVVNWGLETDTNTVDFVRVSGLDAAVAGADVFVKIDGGNTLRGAVPAGGGQVKITPSAPLDPSTIETVEVWIEG